MSEKELLVCWESVGFLFAGKNAGDAGRYSRYIVSQLCGASPGLFLSGIITDACLCHAYLSSDEMCADEYLWSIAR